MRQEFKSSRSTGGHKFRIQRILSSVLGEGEETNADYDSDANTTSLDAEGTNFLAKRLRPEGIGSPMYKRIVVSESNGRKRIVMVAGNVESVDAWATCGALV